ncbi:DUF952 domain-containing protein [Actinocorallia sp. A-T 12471]|uniref:DUF952 domain-containing protein n=1 Tax=Actinocorallia sp. A-T 12471 TaxID=3089813 RepID=UPI0029D0A622|nr:DUF952 domain-containing protein [Actinocorallia sp. A-T 12471]MDX6742649.1 DUF952 domain-containing protein [Actinocorallia sp. A-T 12471]
MSAIFHVADRVAWAAATPASPYAMSTRDQTLAEVGFIHCCTEPQLPHVLTTYYSDADPTTLCLLEIDPASLDVRYEPAPTGDLFPHLYSPLPPSSVIRVLPLPNTR